MEKTFTVNKAIVMVLAVIAGVFLVVAFVSAATTISTNIVTGGTLTAGTTTIIGEVAVTPVRSDNGSGYAYLFNLNDSGSSNGVDTGTGAMSSVGAAKKTYAVNADVNRPTADAVTGDSNDSIFKGTYSNFAANDSNFVMRGLNTALTNRSGGTLGILEGGSLGAQNKSGGTAPTLRGLSVTPENYGTNATEFGGVSIDLKNEAGMATLSYGLRVRALDIQNSGNVGAAILIPAKGSTNTFNYGLDMNGSTLGTADFRLQNGNTISNATAGTVAVSGTLTAATTTATTALVIPSGTTPSDTNSCAGTSVGALFYDTDAAAGLHLLVCNGSTWGDVSD